jgi:hypothetical protein
VTEGEGQDIFKSAVIGFAGGRIWGIGLKTMPISKRRSPAIMALRLPVDESSSRQHRFVNGRAVIPDIGSAKW